MKYMKNLKKALGPLVDYLEESMAQYVESQDRIRHITTSIGGFINEKE